MVQLPAGMRNNNPGNIKYVGQAGTTPSSNLDQGDPQAVFASPQAGMAAMYQLLMRKYQGGKVTPNMIIAANGGWTPGNTQAAANVAKTMGIGADDDIGMGDPARASKFMRALMLQEHGNASMAYTDDQINAAIGGGAGQQPGEVNVADYRAGKAGDKPVYVGTQSAVPVGGTPPQPAPGDAPGTAYAAATPAAKDAKTGLDKKGWRNALAHAVGGYQMPNIAKSDTALGGMAMPAAARVDAPAISPFDPNQIANQRQQLAMAMQKLNSGKLWI